MSWNTEGLLTDPSAGDILADTGALGLGGLLSLTLLGYSTATAILELVLRNALNNADVKVQPLYCIAATLFVGPVPILLSANQRVVVRLKDSMTGSIQVSVLG